MKKYQFFRLVFIAVIFPQISFADFRDLDRTNCPVDNKAFQRILFNVKKGRPNALASVSNCLRTSHKLVFQACLIDPSQLLGAAEMFRDDENFVLRLIKIHPQTLLYVSNHLRKDKVFVEKSTYINRDALKYADESLLDDILFMEKMIQNDSKNYIYASPRIKKMKKHATKAFKDDGRLIMYAPDEVRNNKKLAIIALKSNVAAFDSIGERLRKDGDILKIVGKREISHKKNLEKLLRDKYIKEAEIGNVGKTLDKNARIFKDNALIERNYISKWQGRLKFNRGYLQEDLGIVSVDGRNYPNSWKEDLKEYPELVAKIEKFFLKRFVDEKMVDSLSLTYLWKAKDDPLTLAFNLYLLSETNDQELGDEYVSVTSITAIAQKTSQKEWKLSVVDANFSNEIKTSIAYENAHKKYVIQDLYVNDENDKNPQVIFRVEDDFEEYFEIFSSFSDSKYRLTYRIDPLKIKIIHDSEYSFWAKPNREEQEELDWLEMMLKCSHNPKCAPKIIDDSQEGD